MQLTFLRTYGGPPLAPVDYLARNGLLPEEADSIEGEQDAVLHMRIVGRSHAETATSLTSPVSLRTQSMTQHSGGSVSDTSERSYATSLAHSEAGQSARRKKTMVRAAITMWCIFTP